MFLPDGAEILLRKSLCSGQLPPSAASALEQKKKAKTDKYICKNEYFTKSL